MIKTFPPTQWQIFVDQDSDIQMFEDLINQRGIFKDTALYGQFKSYDKMDDIIDGKLGYRYTFYPLTTLTESQVVRVLNLYLEAAK